VLESTRREEERVRRETAEGLIAFRQRQEEADKKLLQSQQGDAISPADEAEEEWTVGSGGRKRKRKVEREGLRGVKLRRSSTAASGDLRESGESSGPAVAETPTLQKQAQDAAAAQGNEPDATVKLDSKPGPKSTVSPPPQRKTPAPAPVKGGLGLVDYGSDSDDD
jgi:hypothetical protein